MPKLGDFRGVHLDAEFGQQGTVVHLVKRGRRGFRPLGQESLAIQRGENRKALFLFADAIQPHRMNPLEDVAPLAVLRRTAVSFDEALDFLEARNDPLLARRADGRILRFDIDAEFREQGVVLLGELLIHRRPPPSCERGRPPPPPCASPRDPATL